MTDEEIYREAIQRFEVVETMIDNEFSRRNETAPLIDSINKLFHRIKELRNFSKF